MLSPRHTDKIDKFQTSWRPSFEVYAGWAKNSGDGFFELGRGYLLYGSSGTILGQTGFYHKRRWMMSLVCVWVKESVSNLLPRQLRLFWSPIWKRLVLETKEWWKFNHPLQKRQVKGYFPKNPNSTKLFKAAIHHTLLWSQDTQQFVLVAIAVQK